MKWGQWVQEEMKLGWMVKREVKACLALCACDSPWVTVGAGWDKEGGGSSDCFPPLGKRVCGREKG